MRDMNESAINLTQSNKCRVGLWHDTMSWAAWTMTIICESVIWSDVRGTRPRVFAKWKKTCESANSPRTKARSLGFPAWTDRIEVNISRAVGVLKLVLKYSAQIFTHAHMEAQNDCFSSTSNLLYCCRLRGHDSIMWTKRSLIKSKAKEYHRQFLASLTSWDILFASKACIWNDRSC